MKGTSSKEFLKTNLKFEDVVEPVDAKEAEDEGFFIAFDEPEEEDTLDMEIQQEVNI